MKRRNIDERLRKIERDAQAGDPGAQARLDRERRRAGVPVTRQRAETPGDLVREIRAWWKTKEPEWGDLSYEVTFWTPDARFGPDGAMVDIGRGWTWKGEAFGNAAPLNMTSEGGFNRILCYAESRADDELVNEWNALIDSLGWRWETNACWAFSFYKKDAAKNPGFGATLAALDSRHAVAGKPRRNADDRLRVLERRAEASGAADDVAAFAAERRRVGIDTTSALDSLLGRLLTDTFDKSNPAGKKVRHTALKGLATSLLAMTANKAVKDNFRLFHYVFGELGLAPMVRDGIWVTVAHRRVPYRVGIDPVREFQELWSEVVTDDPDDQALFTWARSGAQHSVRVLVPEAVEYARLLKRRLAADDL